MALSKIQSESMNLADTYAFTGTVTGTPSGALTKIQSYTIPSSTSEFNLNGIFTSTYDHYLILAQNIGLTGSGGYINIRLNRASNNSHITADYVQTAIGYEGGASGVQRSGGAWRVNNQATMYPNTSGEQGTMIAMHIFSPFLSMPTKFSNIGHLRNSQNSAWLTVANAVHNTSNDSVGGLNWGTDNGQNFTTSETSAITIYGYEN